MNSLKTTTKGTLHSENSLAYSGRPKLLMFLSESE